MSITMTDGKRTQVLEPRETVRRRILEAQGWKTVDAQATVASDAAGSDLASEVAAPAGQGKRPRARAAPRGK